MAEVEDVARFGPGFRQYLSGRVEGEGRSAETASGVEVALDGLVPHASSAFVEVHVPVDADHGAVGAAHQGQQLTGTDAEENCRHVQVGDALEDSFRRGQGEALVLRAREGTGPRVEELHGLRAVANLRAQKADGDLDEPVEQLVEERRLAVHQGLDDGELTGGASLDEVARDREGRARETDQRRARGGELFDDEIDGARDVAHVVLVELR